jgi:transposase InsO family protein
MATESTSPLPSDTLKPSITIVNHIGKYAGAVLDKTKGNWLEWSEAILDELELANLSDHILEKPLVLRPPATTQPVAHLNWGINDRSVRAYIRKTCAKVERQGLTKLESARDYWKFLERLHLAEGPVRQANLIQGAFSARIPRDKDQVTKTRQIQEDIFRAFDMPGGITRDSVAGVAILMALAAGGHDHTCMIIQRDLQDATTDKPYESDRMIKYVEQDLQLLLGVQSNTASSANAIALAATMGNSSSPHICSNCKRTGHLVPYCVREGGGMAGKSIAESRAQRVADNEAKRKKGKSGGSNTQNTGGKVSVTGVDKNGRAFVAYIDPPSSDTASDTAGFAGFASIDANSASFNPEEYEIITSTDDLEEHAFSAIPMPSLHDAFISVPIPQPIYIDSSPSQNQSPDAAALPRPDVSVLWKPEELRATIDWNTQVRPIDNAHISTAPLSQGTRTPLSLTDHPYYADTGATCHLTPEREDFITLRPVHDRRVKGVNGSSINASGIGDVKLRVARGAYLVLKDVLFIPQATVRLISIGTLARDSNVISHFGDDECWFTNKSTGAVVARGTFLSSRLYSLNLHSAQAEHALSATTSPGLETWHRRLGHPSYQILQEMARKGTVKGMSPSRSSVPPSKCESCILGKQTRTSVPKKRMEGEGHRATRRLEKVWVDLTGPSDVEARGGYRYIMNIVDDLTSNHWSVPLRLKSDAFPELQAWTIRQETVTGEKLGIFITDNGELKSNEMGAWLATRGSDQRLTAPYTSAHNGRVERLHRTLMGKARAMRNYAKAPADLWAEFYLTASHLHKRTPIRSLNGISGWEAWHGRAPDYSYLREIGCKCFVLIQNRNNPKIYDRSIECILIGYDLKSKSYRCYSRTTRQIYSSYHVRFIESHEHSSPATSPNPSPPSTTITPSTPNSISEITDTATPSPTEFHDDDDEDFLPANIRDPIPDPITLNPPDQPPAGTHDAPAQRRSARIATAPPPEERVSQLQRALKEVEQSRVRKQEQRAENKRKRLEDIRQEELRNDPQTIDQEARDNLCELGNERVVDNPLEEVAQAFKHLSLDDKDTDPTERIDKILAAIADTSNIDPCSFGPGDEPKDWPDSQKRPPKEAAEWAAAFKEECNSLRDMGVYVLVPRSSVPVNQKIRRCKAVLRNKLNNQNRLSRRKVRFVFKGYEQIYGKDYTSSTSPTARMESWRILLHLAGALDWDAQQIDIKTAFLYGLLPDDEVQYMEQPEGFEEVGKEDWVWKLQRGLYGMKQAGRIWNKTMNDAMLSWGFTRLSCESCIYYRHDDSGTVIAAVHVDDFLSIANSREANEVFKSQMKQIWTISDLGDVQQLVGIAIVRNRAARTISLSQTALIDRIISQFGQSDAFPVDTPMDSGLKLRRPDRTKLTPEELATLAKLPYRSLVGCLIYLAIASRLDITYAVQQLSQFLDCYSFAHWNAAIRVVRYLKGSKNLQLVLGGTNPINLVGFTDSDWANCLDTRRSVGGYAFSLGSGVISWTSRKQKTVASSSCEAEYTAAFESSKEAIWLRMVLTSINLPPSGPTTILCDNNAAINLSEDPSLHQRVKHVDIKYHFLRERVQSKEIKLSYVNTNDNIADIFTKALDKIKFKRLRAFLGLQ